MKFDTIESRIHMRVQRILRRPNWRYFLGEFILIVASILFALAVSDWNQNRHRYADERAALNEIRSSLLSDQNEIAAAVNGLRTVESRIEALLTYLRSPGDYSDTLDIYFGAAYGIIIAQPNLSPYESVKSRGLDLISDNALRLQITNVYDRHYRRVTWRNELETNVAVDALRPYYLEHFRDLRFRESATPLDYGALVRDPLFRNLIDYRLSALRNTLIVYETALNEVRNLTAALSHALNN